MTDSLDASPTKGWRRHGEFLAYVAKRFALDQCTGRAAALTYTSLLALVPLLAISFAIFSAFPAFDDLQIKVQIYIFSNFVPEVGDTVLQYLEGFTKQTGKLTAVGIIFLVATSIMLLMSISNAFDAIWRVRSERSLVARLLVYWAVLTLAPLFLGASISLSGYLFALAQSTGVEQYTGRISAFAGVLPLLFQFGGFAVLYLVMPNSSVRIRDALVGGFTAALLFEILKKLFGFYVTAFPTYETIYGALATFPIFLIWMYISWLVVLLGAELTASRAEWRRGQRNPNASRSEPPTERLTLSLAALYTLAIASRSGRRLSHKQLSNLVDATPAVLDMALRDLDAAHYIARSREGDWLLQQDLGSVTLHDLCRALELTLDVPSAAADAPEWRQRYGLIAGNAATAAEGAMSTDLRKILTPAEDTTTIESLETLRVAAKPGAASSRRARILAWIGLGWLGSS